MRAWRPRVPDVLLPPKIKRSKHPKVSRCCPAHRAWVRRHQCSVPGCQRGPIECAHVRKGTDGGVGLKPSDRWVVSLCAYHHQEQHRLGEATFGDRYVIDLAKLAVEFSRRSPYRVRLNDTGC